MLGQVQIRSVVMGKAEILEEDFRLLLAGGISARFGKLDKAWNFWTAEQKLKAEESLS